MLQMFSSLERFCVNPQPFLGTHWRRGRRLHRKKHPCSRAPLPRYYPLNLLFPRFLRSLRLLR